LHLVDEISSRQLPGLYPPGAENDLVQLEHAYRLYKESLTAASDSPARASRAVKQSERTLSAVLGRLGRKYGDLGPLLAKAGVDAGSPLGQSVSENPLDLRTNRSGTDS
jgi:hypothetical protein